MATTTIGDIAIRGIASALPGTVRHNSDIGVAADRDYVEKLSHTVGVRTRHVVRDGQFGSDLALAAASNLLQVLGWEPSSIDLLVVATQTPDRLFPGVSFVLHRRLQLSPSCPVFDINLGCSAFTHGLWTVGSLLPRVGGRALLVNVDTMSRTLGADDIGNQVMFGDGAAVTALEVDASAADITVVLQSDGKGTEAVCMQGSGMAATAGELGRFIINGPAVLGLALRAVPKLVQMLLDASALDASDIGLFVPHQANQFILEKLADRLPLDPESMLIAMDTLGNTSSASIPLAMCTRSERFGVADRRHVMMIGFGTGFSLSGVIADLEGCIVVEPVLLP